MPKSENEELVFNYQSTIPLFCRLSAFLFVPVFTQALFAFVSVHFFAFSFFT